MAERDDSGFNPDWQAESRARFETALAELGAPLFGIDSAWQCYRSLGGWGSQGVSLRHQRDGVWVEVATALPTEHVGRDAHAVIHWMSVQLNHADDLVFPLNLHLEKWQDNLEIDGSPVPFVFIGDLQVWVAHGEHDGRDIRLDGRGVDPRDLALTAVDPDAYYKPGW